MVKSRSRQFIWFLSSYSPLFFGLLLKELDYSSGSSIIASLVSRSSVILIIILFLTVPYQCCQLQKASGGKEYEIKKDFEAEPQSDMLLNYLITYITPFLTFSSGDINSIVVNAYLFFIFAVLYINSSAIFLNPLLGLAGYKIYAVKNMASFHHVISKISYDELDRFKREKQKVKMTDLGNGVAVIDKIQKNNY